MGAPLTKGLSYPDRSRLLRPKQAFTSDANPTACFDRDLHGVGASECVPRECNGEQGPV